MTTVKALRVLLLGFLITELTPIGVWRVQTSAQENGEVVSLCELTKDWKKYDHKVVRIRAIYRTGPETSEVYDLDCPDSDHVAWVPPDLAKMAPADMVDKMSRLLRPSGRAQIVARGEFDGPKKVDIPPGTSPGLAATLQAADSHYGHQNGWDFQFVIARIEKVEPAPADAPWPHWTSEKKQ
jgi:hypothetical protein